VLVDRGEVMLGRTEVVRGTLSPEFIVPLRLSPHTAGPQSITVRVGVLSLRDWPALACCVRS
jgi:hypothetical protein